MKLFLLVVVLSTLGCARKSDPSEGQAPVQNPAQERSAYSAKALVHVEIRQGEIEFLENAFNEDRSTRGSCFVEVHSGEIQSFKLFEDKLEITAKGVTQSYRRIWGRSFSIYGKWEFAQTIRSLTLTSSILISEDKTVELTNTCEINRALN